MGALLRLLLDWGPLVVFFVANAKGGIMVATAAFMAAAVVVLPLYRRLDGRWPVMPLVTCGFVVVFGGLTLWLNDDTFIKVKATIIYLLFAAILGVGMVLRRNLLAHVLVGVEMDATGWRRLTVRWLVFFLILAAANEAAWRLLTTNQWVAYKSFVVIPLFLLFSMAQVPMILRHQVETPSDGDVA